jgi:hypothetical protein
LLILALAGLLTILGFKVITGLDSASRTGFLNSLNRFSMVAGMLSRGFTFIDAIRVGTEWVDRWPRDETGKVIKGLRISAPPLTVPAPVAAKPAAATTAGRLTEAIEVTPRDTGRPHTYALTDLAEITIS